MVFTVTIILDDYERAAPAPSSMLQLREYLLEEWRRQFQGALTRIKWPV